jgi:release factor glutamine methyltransferase
VDNVASSTLRSQTARALRAAGCVFAEDEARLLIAAARSPGELDAMLARRVAGLPLEQVVGWAGFCGLRIFIEPGVFVPRRRTEFLAREALAVLPPGGIAVDMCCGAGAIAAVLAGALAGVLTGPSAGALAGAARKGVLAGASAGTARDGIAGEVHACDIDPAAVRCARRNTAGGVATVYQGDLFGPLPATLRGRVDVLAVNPPYVPSGEVPLLPAEAREHEPITALDGGTDGLDILRRVTAVAAGWLAPGGHLLAETSERQSGKALAAFSAGGLTAEIRTDPELDATIVTGWRGPGGQGASRAR